MLLLTLAVPLMIRGVNARRVGVSPPSYLPALEGPRSRDAFDPRPVAELAGMRPDYVIIGDSMAGTRIDPARLRELTGRSVAPLLQAGSGPAWWYLVLKNWVIASGVRPKYVFIFFRDTNLTTVMYRLDDRYRWMIDLVAQDREDELNQVIASATAGAWHRTASRIDAAYDADRARRWMEPALTEWVGRTLIPSRRRHAEFMTSMNARFGLEHLTPMDAADLQAAQDEEADFGTHVHRSVLPLMLRDARAAGLTLCFVRVQRRPRGGRPPYQSPAVRQYVGELKRYVEANGALWRDDTGDPAMTLDLYGDGDHVASSARTLYTEMFYERLRSLFQ